MLLDQDTYKIRSGKFKEFSDLIMNAELSSSVVECVHETDHYPSKMNLSNLLDVDCGDIDVLGAARDFVADIKKKYNLDCHICAYYPPGGYIDWHTNENIATYNALCTFSSEGKSFFEYKTSIDSSRCVYDPVGWSVKMTKWSKTDPVWHRAVANDKRITVTFSSRKIEDVERFIKDIT